MKVGRGRRRNFLFTSTQRRGCIQEKEGKRREEEMEKLNVVRGGGGGGEKKHDKNKALKSVFYQFAQDVHLSK